MAQIFTKPVRNMCGTKAERYRQSREFLQATVTTCQRLPNPVKANALTVSGAYQPLALPCHTITTSASHLPVRLSPPSLKSRTLCSVGFHSLKTVHAIHAAIGLSGNQCRLGQVLKSVTVQIRIELRYHAPQHEAQIVANCPVPDSAAFANKLLAYWLRRARPP